MNDPFHHLEWVPHDSREIAVEVTHAQLTQLGTVTQWRPAVNAFRCQDTYTIYVDLAGASEISTHIASEPTRLVIRGRRALFEPTCNEPQPAQVLALEIDHGPFERVLDLPDDVDPGKLTAEHRNGVLAIRLPLSRN